MSLWGAASSYLCPVAGYMCTEGTNLCGRRIRTKEATDLRSAGLQEAPALVLAELVSPLTASMESKCCDVLLVFAVYV